MSMRPSLRTGLLTILPARSQGRGCPWFGPAKSGCEQRVPLRICIDERESGDAVEALNQFVGVGDLEIFNTSDFHFHPDRARTPDVLPVSCSADNAYFGVYFLDRWSPTVRTLGVELPDRTETDLRDALRRALAATSHGAHIYATDDPAMLSPSMRGLPGTRMSTRQSVAMAGLYLRAWNETAVFRDGWLTMTASPASLYKEGALHLLPSFKAWFVAASGAATDTSWMPIGITVAERMSRTLRARDRMQAALQNDQAQENVENALFYLDTFILQLDAALDALAGATSLLRGWGLRGIESSWGSKQWRRKVRASGNDAMSSVIAQGLGDDLPRLLSMLRNTIHSSLLSPVTVSQPGQHHRRTHVRIPNEPQRSQLLSYGRSCGGYKHWGINAQSNWLDPCTFVESAIIAVPDLLNRFMAAQYPDAPSPPKEGEPNSLARLVRARTPLVLGLPT